MAANDDGNDDCDNGASNGTPVPTTDADDGVEISGADNRRGRARLLIERARPQHQDAAGPREEQCVDLSGLPHKWGEPPAMIDFCLLTDTIELP